MNLNLQRKTHIHKKSNFLLYTIEQGDTPFLYYHMIKTVNQIITLPTIYLKHVSDALNFMDKHFTDYTYRGTIFWNDENYIFYEIVDTVDFTPTYFNDSWWKVTPYEILYTQKVLTYTVDKYYLPFFKENPNTLFLFINDIKYETPIVGYLGLDETELNRQFLLGDVNYNKGYYFGTIQKAYYQSLYDPKPEILQFVNNGITKGKVVIKANKFYINDMYIGDVPNHCKGKYTLHHYNDDFIYLKCELLPSNCFIKRQNNGCMIRYVLFLKKTSIGTKLKKGDDSFTCGQHEPDWFPKYMVKNSNQFAPLSYHYSMDTLDDSFITKKDKDTLIRIK
jgi:hypothetical protein